MPAESNAAERMAWLDGLRAVAVLLVVYAHLSRTLFTGARAFSSERLHAGTAGVMLFFLVSGYIIPASLERHGSLRTFWVSRLCRLLPLYVVVTLAVVALHAGGLLPLDPALAADPLTAAVAHVTMLPQLLGVPLVTPVLWTLTFEMAFYLLVGALFAVRLHGAGSLLAMVLAGLAVGTAPLAPLLLAGTPAAARTLTLLVAAALVVGLGAVAGGRRRAVVAGAVLLGGLAATLLVAGQDPAHAWDGLLIIAVMLVGTAVHRADHGRIRWWQAGVVAAVVATALLVNWCAELASLHALTPRYVARSVLTLVVFAGAFALFRLTRRWRTPRPLAWVGLVSYSVYLVHYVLIELLRPVLTDLGDRLPALAEVPVAAAYLGLVAGISWLTYRFVELPGQRFGRRAARWMTARWGSDARPAGPVAAQPANRDPRAIAR
ncbi:acyltransferase family protein [Actinoplanes sp. NPDC049599]|uniref:acyltransferase family protein n=1 Tax=Actinoplanes sp. NPDC049599 TaxID=3363903 RepID=UPI0037B0D173